jgi:hypothetical protein
MSTAVRPAAIAPALLTQIPPPAQMVVETPPLRTLLTRNESALVAITKPFVGSVPPSVSDLHVPLSVSMNQCSSVSPPTLCGTPEHATCARAGATEGATVKNAVEKRRAAHKTVKRMALRWAQIPFRAILETSLNINGSPALLGHCASRMAGALLVRNLKTQRTQLHSLTEGYQTGRIRRVKARHMKLNCLRIDQLGLLLICNE